MQGSLKPKFCIYHRHTRHPTTNCWTLKRNFRQKQLDNELRVGQHDVREEPYLNHRNQEREREVNRAECYPFMYDDEEEDSEGWAYMVSCYEITKDFASYPNPAVIPDPNSSVRTLQNSAKFRTFFDGFGFTPTTRLEMTKAIMNITEVHQKACMPVEGSVLQTIRDESNLITFTDADRQVPFLHNRPLYVTACVNSVELKRVFLDDGASINLMPLSTFKMAGIPKNRIVKNPIAITGFGGDKRESLGYVVVDLIVGAIHSTTKFHLINADPNYHIILGCN